MKTKSKATQTHSRLMKTEVLAVIVILIIWWGILTQH